MGQKVVLYYASGERYEERAFKKLSRPYTKINPKDLFNAALDFAKSIGFGTYVLKTGLLKREDFLIQVENALEEDASIQDRGFTAGFVEGLLKAVYKGKYNK